MKALARRAFLRFAGGAAAAPPLLPAVAQQRVGGSIASLSWATPLTHPEEGMPTSGLASNQEGPIRKVLRQALQRAQNDTDASMIFRLGAFEPDIAALVSVSYVAKCRMQRVRDERRRSIADEIRRKLGWL